LRHDIIKGVYLVLCRKDKLIKQLYTQYTMAVNDFVMVPPQISHYADWEKGQIIEVENNPWRGIVLVVRMENGDIFWDVADCFKKEA